METRVLRLQAEAGWCPQTMEAPTSTLNLIKRYRSGEEEAFSSLFEKYQRRLAVLIYYKLGPELHQSIEVDDILQETFLVASEQMANFSYRSPGSFLSWLSVIAEHAIIDAARFQNRQKRRPAEMLRLRSESNPGGPEPVDTKTPSRLFAQEEQLKKLLEKLTALPDQYRQVILMAKFEGLSTLEMAEQLKKSREDVALLLHRALKRLRESETIPPRT
jgi:RNA polymerase sigma-70 factor (subfamily 1)